MTRHFEAFLPTRLVFGEGRLREAGDLARGLGKRALVVTSRRAMDRLGYTDRLLESLQASGVSATVFRGLSPNPTTDDVDKAAEQARAEQADLVIGLGGGSALDCAKATAATAPLHVPSAELLHQRACATAEALPILSIPTTAGTGSETNRSAMLTDPATQHKDGIRSDYLFPRVALVDPELTYDLPAQVTAHTGFDALAHAIESYVSPKAQPLADALALAAIGAVVAALPRAMEEPHQAQAPRQLSWAATAMGFNLACVGTCLPHRLDKPLCARFPQLTHGQAIAAFYRPWMAHGWRGSPERFARVTSLLHPPASQWPTDEAAAACEGQIAALLARLGMADSLAGLGIVLAPSEIDALVERVSGDLRANPVPLERSQLFSFFSQRGADQA